MAGSSMTDMAGPDVTIVIVPRERFSEARPALESIFLHTTIPYDLVYVDAGSPEPLKRYLENKAAERNFRLLRVDRYLPGNEARNLALPHIKTKYAVFVDNDVLVSPFWLEPLIACAEETGTWAVAPLYCEGDPQEQLIHTAGADVEIVEQDGRRVYREQHRFWHRRRPEVAGSLRRGPSDLVELHCVLLSATAIARLNGFDPELLSFFDCADISLCVRNAGGAIFCEPASIVTYRPPRSFEASDIGLFLLRWSNRWLTPSLRHFCAKHGLDPADPKMREHIDYQQAQRARLIRHPRGAIKRLFGQSGLQFVESCIDAGLDHAYVGRAARKAGSGQTN